MGREKSRKKLVYLSEEQKMNLMKDYDESGLAASKVCKEHGVSLSTLYKIKEIYWPIYKATKESDNNRDKIATLNTIKVHNTRKAVLVETQAATVMEKVLALMLHKLEIEEDRLRGIEIIGENGEPIKLSDKDVVTVSDLTKFFQVAAPFFMKSVDPSADGRGMKQTHSFMTNILQNLTINNNSKQHGTDQNN